MGLVVGKLWLPVSRGDTGSTGKTDRRERRIVFALFFNVLVGDLRRTRLCCSGSERRRICTPKWGHSAFSFWFWVVGDHPSALISQSKQSWHVSRVAACNGAATRSGRPTHRHTTHNGRLSRTIGHRTHRKHLAAQMGGGIIPHTPEQRRHLTRQRSLDVAGALPSPIAFSTAACGHAPRRAGLGGRPRSRTRCGHARWLRWLRA